MSPSLRTGRTVSENWQPPLVDALIAAAFASMVVVETLFDESMERPGAFLLVAGPAMVSLAWRRRFPLLVCSLVAVSIFGFGFDQQLSPTLAMPLLMYTVGAETEGRWSYLGLGLMFVPFFVLLSIEGLEPSDVGAGLVFIVAPWLLGSANRQRSERAEEAVERADRLERERELLAAVAAGEERTRIARELHDIVAHSLSMVTVQTQAVRRRLGADHPQEATDLAAVEAAAREAMVEMRRLFGVLRADSEEISLSPQPGLQRLDRLAEQTKNAGTQVEVRTEGEPRTLPPGIDLTAYRIVQEAITNAVRHGEAKRIDVVVSYTPFELALCVEDDGRGMDISAQGNPDAGHGLVGLRERVALYGGSLDLRSSPGHGVILRACLPLEPL